jgi:hypothetical protein
MIKRFGVVSGNDINEEENGRYVLYEEHIVEMAKVRQYAIEKISAMNVIMVDILEQVKKLFTEQNNILK